MKLKDYKFQVNSWPPPREKQNRETYLFGFDVDNQPYILRWETRKGSQGWCSVTLEDSLKNYSVSADPRYFSPTETVHRMEYWADAPLTKDVVARYAKDRA